MHRAGVVAIALAVAVAACGTTGAPHARRSARAPASTRPAPVATTTLPLPLPPGAVPGTTSIGTLASGGTARTYRLHTPASFDATHRVPVVVVLHGATGTAERVELRYHWDPLADRDGFFVVYPQGVLDQWNAVLDGRAEDDVAFLGALVDDLVTELPVDPGRVFVAGMSNGAAMTYRLGCVLSDRITAIAAVEGWNPGCAPDRPVSLVVVHGRADGEVAFVEAERSVEAWRGFDGCPDPANRDDGGPEVTHTVWGPCAAGTAVELYAVADGGHEWPGSWPPLPDRDPPSPALDATAAIWDFFRTQAR